jgi:hypothetical protein
MDILSARFQTKVHFRNKCLDVNKKGFAVVYQHTRVVIVIHRPAKNLSPVSLVLVTDFQ